MLKSKIIFPIAEMFTSIQGEGMYTGTPMLFVRFAGCNVGIVQDGAVHCNNVFGSPFCCDTNFKQTFQLSLQGLVQHIDNQKITHVCLTGGEPFLHPILDLIETCRGDKIFHIETSGTHLLEDLVDHAWITCSPKIGFNRRNFIFPDEWKFVVSQLEDLQKVARFLENALQDKAVFIQPAAPTFGLADRSFTLKLIEALSTDYPDWRLSVQTHKLLGLK